MNGTGPTGLLRHFEGIADPRVERTKAHALLDIIVIAVCAVICGADDWVDVAGWGEEKLSWLRQFMPLENGIPSHDTFGRVFSRLDAEAFESAFLSWVQAAFAVSAGQVVAIDGKQMRRSHDRTLGKSAIYMVSAWAADNHLTLGQRQVGEKSNEITAIPKLLEGLALNGCIVTIDAMGCQTAIAQAIIDKQADYVLALKENQGHLSQDTRDLFTYAAQTPSHTLHTDYTKTIEKGHGRIEIRECWTITAPLGFPAFRSSDQWAGLRTLVKIRRERRLAETTSVEISLYLSSLPGDAPPLLQAVRSHWDIENGLHGVLDIAFREDEQRARKGNSPHNFSIIRHMALNLLKHETTLKVGVHAKRLRAAWSEAYLLKVLGI